MNLFADHSHHYVLNVQGRTLWPMGGLVGFQRTPNPLKSKEILLEMIGRQKILFLLREWKNFGGRNKYEMAGRLFGGANEGTEDHSGWVFILVPSRCSMSLGATPDPVTAPQTIEKRILPGQGVSSPRLRRTKRRSSSPKKIRLDTRVHLKHQWTMWYAQPNENGDVQTDKMGTFGTVQVSGRTIFLGCSLAVL